jgi:hypothetical protein
MRYSKVYIVCTYSIHLNTHLVFNKRIFFLAGGKTLLLHQAIQEVTKKFLTYWLNANKKHMLERKRRSNTHDQSPKRQYR